MFGKSTTGSDRHPRNGDADPSDAQQRDIRTETSHQSAESDADRKGRQGTQQDPENQSEDAKKGLLGKIISKIHPLVLLAAIAVSVVVVGGIIVPFATSPETHYMGTTSLENMVRTAKLSTVEYVYKGIARREPNTFGLFQLDPGYYVKYAASVKVSFDLSKVELAEEGSNIVVYLPEPVLGDPKIDETNLDFMPEEPSGDLGELLKICKEDAREGLKENDSAMEMASENMERTITALVKPFVDDNHEIEFRPLDEYVMEASDEQKS